MSTDLKFQIKSSSSSNTELIGRQIGANLKGGEVIRLSADLGGGKTTLTRGILDGLGSADMVASPTFTISKLYTAGDLSIHHFDFYRLNDAGIIANELSEVAEDPNNIVIIEWADIIQDILPGKTINIALDYDSEDTRQISFTLPKGYEYIIKGIK
jgi:tRNA threonylcarbamoyladenosine biosynthesis protein TsaE